MKLPFDWTLIVHLRKALGSYQGCPFPSVFSPTPPALPGCRLGWVAVTEADHLLRVTRLTGRG